MSHLFLCVCEHFTSFKGWGGGVGLASKRKLDTRE